MGFLTKSKGTKRKFIPPRMKSSNTAEPHSKRARLTSTSEAQTNTADPSPGTQPNKNQTVSAPTPTSTSDSPTSWKVYYCKRSKKKHKNYMDGILRRQMNKLCLFDADTDKKIGEQLWQNAMQQTMDKEEPIYLGAFQVEIDAILDNHHSCEQPSAERSDSQHHANNHNHNHNHNNNQSNSNKQHQQFKAPKSLKATAIAKNSNPKQPNLLKRTVNDHGDKHGGGSDEEHVEHVLVLDDGSDGDGASKVCVAKFLSCVLRPHQKEGIRFMYECISGKKNGAEQRGAINADDMGLGKTLQVIALLHTLMNHGPLMREMVRKCVVVCPASLVGNWYKEFAKWINHNKRGRLAIVAMDEKNKQKRDAIVTNFARYSMKNVLIIGYEMLRSYVDVLCGGGDDNGSKSRSKQQRIDLLVCDEGHRLKQVKGNQTIEALNKVAAHNPGVMRCLLTGTPIQNNLSELYAMCEFVNPSCLDSFEHFKRTFQNPIEKSRDANATAVQKQLGDERSRALHEITNRFIVRRTAECILRHYLQPKHEYVIFHALSPLQIKLYQSIVSNKSVQCCVAQHNMSMALLCITYLRMCCCSPRLALLKITNANVKANARSTGNGLHIDIPSAIRHRIFSSDSSDEAESSDSEKFNVLRNLLQQTHAAKDKIVVVSNYTSVLDEVALLLQQHDYAFLRLDGTTSATARTKLVSTFNAAQSAEFIFLLSAKAGGVGLNLVGANRLVLMDPDFNPAVDQQAMARIWRDGQRKPCKIYRLIAVGSIEEKIYQRQILKLEVCDSVVDRNGKSKHKHKDRHFAKEELKELFTLKSDIQAACETMDLLHEKFKEWKICTHASLIQSVVRTDFDAQIPVIFERAVDPKVDDMQKWGIADKEAYLNACDDGEEHANDHDGQDDEEDAAEFHDSDFDDDDEYELQQEMKETEHVEEEVDDEIEVLSNRTGTEKSQRANSFEEDSDEDTKQSRTLHKDAHGGDCVSGTDIEKRIKEITSTNDDAIDFDFLNDL